MTRPLRWRILSLQLIATLVLAAVAGLCFWGHSFVQDQVTSQLSAQQIVFPPATSPALAALPTADAAAMKQYAGQTMTTGYQAHTYAERFIANHLKEIGQGKTYAYWSGKALAEQQSNPKQFAIDNTIALTLFRGETLRSMLDQAWAFWFVGDLVFYGAIALLLGALATAGAFLFELFYSPKHEGVLDLQPATLSRSAVVS